MLNQKGMAAIEMIPILILFILLFNFTLGFFGIVHSGILKSMAARNYAFETFRNRANLNYIRDEGGSDLHYANLGYRYHSAIGEGKNPQGTWIASTRPLKFTDVNSGGSEPLATESDHNQKVRAYNDGDPFSQFTQKTRASADVGVDPVWIMTSYGICLSAKCDPPGR
jgi:hypothetical protein